MPTPGFGAGGQGGRFGGLPSPSPMPSVAGWQTDREDSGVGVSQEAVAKVPRVGVAESVADVATLTEDVGRLRVTVKPHAVTLLYDKVVEIGRDFPGIGEQLLGLAEEASLSIGAMKMELTVAEKAVTELAAVREELAGAQSALGKVEYHLSAKEPVLGSDEKGVWVGVNDLWWEIITTRSERARSAKVEAATYLENRRLLGEVKRLEVGRVLRGVDKGTQMPAPPAPPVCIGSRPRELGLR